MGIEDRTFEELDPKEKLAAQQVIYQQLNWLKVREYTSKAQEEIQVTIYRTNKEECFYKN